VELRFFDLLILLDDRLEHIGLPPVYRPPSAEVSIPIDEPFESLILQIRLVLVVVGLVNLIKSNLQQIFNYALLQAFQPLGSLLSNLAPHVEDLSHHRDMVVGLLVFYYFGERVYVFLFVVPLLSF